MRERKREREKARERERAREGERERENLAFDRSKAAEHVFHNPRRKPRVLGMRIWHV